MNGKQQALLDRYIESHAAVSATDTLAACNEAIKQSDRAWADYVEAVGDWKTANDWYGEYFYVPPVVEESTA